MMEKVVIYGFIFLIFAVAARSYGWGKAYNPYRNGLKSNRDGTYTYLFRRTKEVVQLDKKLGGEVYSRLKKILQKPSAFGSKSQKFCIFLLESSAVICAVTAIIFISQGIYQETHPLLLLSIFVLLVPNGVIVYKITKRERTKLENFIKENINE